MTNSEDKEKPTQSKLEKLRAEHDEKIRALLEEIKQDAKEIPIRQDQSAASALYSKLAQIIALSAFASLEKKPYVHKNISKDSLPLKYSTPLQLDEAFTLAQEAIISAQRQASREMHRIGLGHKAKDAERTARKKITQGTNRALAHYNIKANFLTKTIEITSQES